jgi:multicomponent Na+:H+ antiporter subunit F
MSDTSISIGTVVLVLCALAAAALAMLRLLRGPTHADRVVALDIFLAAGVALCVAASLQTQRTVFLDVAIGLALVGFVATMGWARLVERSGAPSATAADNGAGGAMPREPQPPR